MSVIKSLSNAVSMPLDAIANTGKSINQGIDIINVYVQVRHTIATNSMKEEGRLELAKVNQTIANELETDDKLKAQYDALKDLFD